jgi:hypothetical protein
MDSHSKVDVAGENDQDAKLMAELEREEARNREALRMVKEKELQALAARDRAADSQRRMQDMMVRYEEMKQKLEWTRLTLETTASQINQNDIKRAQQIQATVSKLKEKAEYCSGILKKKREREEQNASDIISDNSENLDPILQAPIDTGGSLTEAEKMLLLMCQSQSFPTKDETDMPSKVATEINTTSSVPKNDIIQEEESSYDDSSLTEATQMLLSICQKESPATPKNDSEVHLIGDQAISSTIDNDSKEMLLQEKESNEEQALPLEDAGSENVEMQDVDHEVVQKDITKCENVPDNASERNDDLNTSNDDNANVSSPETAQAAEALVDDDLKDVTKDLKETVTNIEAKCAGVREELGQMAMSEQYMRTKQAQLLAKRREKEADAALQAAAKKEQEAQEMREKVANMMRLLKERKSKLKEQENVLEKRSNVVEKVNKVLDCKLRKADFVQKQRDESLAFANDWLRDDNSKDTAPESLTQKVENEETKNDENSETGVEESH